MSANGLPSKPQQAQTTNSVNPPNQTLYIRNLNDKIQKEDLRRALYTLFSTHGPVLDVVALKTIKMRGQAHIVFQNKNNSTQAMEALQGFNFLGKEMQISYAKGKSDVISRLEGSAYVPEEPKPQIPTVESSKAKTMPPAGPSETAALNPNASLKAPNGMAEDGSKSPQGTKRPRDEASSDDEGEPMQEDDEGEAMEVSDDEED